MKKELLSCTIVFLFLGCDSSYQTSTLISSEQDFNNSSFSDKFIYQEIYQNPYFSDSWHIFPDPVTNTDINVTKAWRQGYTGKNIKIALIDFGFDPAHNDLQNAYFYKVNSDTNSHEVSYDSHGTMCAGIIGARSNFAGSIGVAPSSKLIYIQSKLQTTSETILALNKARDLKVDIVNNSWGSYHVEDLVRESIKELTDTGRDNKGMVVLFASGNDNCSLDSYCEKAQGVPNDESELENVIGVGASNRENTLSSFSNYGENIDLVAPGTKIFSTYKDNSYTIGSGTSYATPIVAGVAALILDANPNLTYTQVKEILEKSASKIGDSTITYSNGKNIFYGYGKVNASAAVELAKSY